MVKRLSTTAAGFDERFNALIGPRGDGEQDVSGIVSGILSDVRERGGEAVATYTEEFDRLDLNPESLTCPEVDLQALAAACPDELREAIDFAAARIGAYHEAQKPDDHRFFDEAGVQLGWRWTALDSVGVYVPGGRASYPSSVLMNVIPAKIAGVDRIVMVAPAPGGELLPAVAYAALKAGVTAYHPIGGAQAVAALAYGAGDLAPVDKIVGPGNAYVAEAKRQVFGTGGIDTIAGPSEILVIADDSANPDWVAADLLSQCEHDPSSQAILLTPDAGLAEAVGEAAEAQLTELSTEAVARRAWETHSAIVVTRDLEDAAILSNRAAPEHVELAVRDPEGLLPSIKHAGAVFLGHHTPEALGDYVTGSNHVLPTSRAARFSSGLGLTDFMKRMSIQRATPDGFAALAPAAARLAKAEGLPAHRRSVTVRTNGAGFDD